jgi:hypothetical protein
MSTRILTLGLLAAIVAAKSHAAGEDSVQNLYDQHCVACHGTEVYTREDRKVRSLSGLERQVRRCEAALGLRWFDEEVSDMTRFLNDRHYHFKP